MNRVLTCLTVEHDWRLVVLAGVICLVSSVLAISLLQRAGRNAGRARDAWLALSAVAGGSGIWATHFVAMLAHRHAGPLAYDSGLTLLSLAIPVAVTALGFWIALSMPWRYAPPAGGLIVGLGIAAMHYTAMSALTGAADHAWQPGLVVASVILGVAFSTAALSVGARSGEFRDVFIAAVLLSIAILSLHFTAMMAIEIAPGAAPANAAYALSETNLALAVTTVAFAILMLLLGAIADNHISLRRKQIADTEAKLAQQNMRLDTALNNMGQGLAMFDAEGRLVLCNNRYIQFYALNPQGRLAGHVARRRVPAAPRTRARSTSIRSNMPRRSATRSKRPKASARPSKSPAGGSSPSRTIRWRMADGSPPMTTSPCAAARRNSSRARSASSTRPWTTCSRA